MMEHEKFKITPVNKYDLPYRLSLLYHDCGNYRGVGSEHYKGGPPICGNCGNVVPWFFYKCVIDGQYFIQDFRHPKFCSNYPTCWQHTLELPWEYCKDHSFKYRLKPFWYHEPIGLNPVQYTDEELADVFEGID